MTSQGRPIYCVHFVQDFLPLSLGMLISYARAKLSPAVYDLTPRFIRTLEQLHQEVAGSGTGVFLFSDYIWNVENHLRASAWVKQTFPNAITIHGGPSVPAYPDACEDFMRDNPHVDFCARGEGEKTVVELLEHLAVSAAKPHQVRGLSFLENGRLVQTENRERSRTLDEFPSPYLTGVFDKLHQNAIYAILETNRGCPYGCTFCDWGAATLQKIRCFSLDRVRAEIEWISAHKMRDLSIADANFGILPRDVEICRILCEEKLKTGYPHRVLINYAKNTHRDVLAIVEMMAKVGLITSGTISIQTRDETTLKTIRRRNIKNVEYEKLQSAFAEKDLPLDSQLMLGLPGATLESFKADLRHYFFEDINVRVFRTVLLPNSPMADPEYRRTYDLKTDESQTILSTSTMSEQDMDDAEFLARLFRCAHDYGMLRYFLSYLYWDHAIDPISYLERLAREMRAEAPLTTRYPLLREFCTDDVENERLIEELMCASKDIDPSNKAATPRKMIAATHVNFREKLRRDGLWAQFYEEVRAYTCATYAPQSPSSIRAALTAQRNLMPAADRRYPFTERLEHDFERYYRSNRARDARRRRLADHEPGLMTVQDPLRLAESGTYRDDWTLTDFWQLASGLPGAGRSTLTKLVSELRAEDAKLLATRV